MRKRDYLSPTSISKWKENPELFYMKYLSEIKLPREPQTLPMSVGSAFDAYIKSDLYARLVGKDDPKYGFQNLFEIQVEEHNRDTALIDGKFCYDQYVKSGALADLLIEMEGSLGEPKFEIELQGKINYGGREVVLLGKPDVFFINKLGGHVVLDFKVNGFYAKQSVSPMKGYLRMHPGCIRHGDCVVGEKYGFKLNTNHKLNHDNMNQDWAAQLSAYAWLCGLEVGSEWIAAIDQLACGRPKKSDFIQNRPVIRIAQHRLEVESSFQHEYAKLACDVWEIINSGYIFRNLSESESQGRCQVLDSMIKDMTENGNLLDTLRGGD